MAVGVSTKIILDTWRPVKDGLFPVKLRVFYKRSHRDYSLPEKKYLGSKEDIEEIKHNDKKKDLKKLLLYFNEIETRANDIIKGMPSFNFPSFERKFKDPTFDNTSFYSVFKEYIETLKKQKRIGTAESYSSSYEILKKYKKSLQFYELTPELLQSFENWMVKKEKSLTTVGIYTRNIRAVYNYSISKGYINRDSYPFGRGKYEIPAGRNIKKALSKSEIKKIIDYSPAPGSLEEFSRDMWLFSYLCNGMNINDIARLKYSNLVDNKSIVFHRQKTRLTKKQNQRPIKAFLGEIALKIIEIHGNDRLPENYIFEILKPGMTDEKIFTTIRQTVKNINNYIRKIAGKLEITKDVTTYTARHTFATMLKHSGVPTDFISEQLGHYDIKTTENYLDSFDDETLIKYTENLTKFE